jgi:hypothetical protein
LRAAGPAGAAAAGAWAALGRRPPWLRRGSLRLGLGVDLGNDLAGDHGVAVALDDLDQHAGVRRGQLQHDLVGLDVDEVLVAGDSLAFLLVPGNQGRFGDGFGQLGDFHVYQHFSLRLLLLTSWSRGLRR